MLAFPAKTQLGHDIVLLLEQPLGSIASRLLYNIGILRAALAKLWCPAGWPNSGLDVTVETFCRCGDTDIG